MLLAFDSATERLAIGLATPAGCWLCNLPGGASASTSLLPEVHALLALAGIGLADLQAVAFGQGPGAFTGLRTACAVAQGLALGIDKPVLPIDSLLIVADDARQQVRGDARGGGTLDVSVLMDARMDEVYAARYRWQRGAWTVQLAPALYTLEATAQLWLAGLAGAGDGPPPHVVAGSALLAFGARLALPAEVQRIQQEQDRAAALLRLACLAAAAGAGIDAALALPLYLRDKVALTTLERDAAKAAKLARAGQAVQAQAPEQQHDLDQSHAAARAAAASRR